MQIAEKKFGMSATADALDVALVLKKRKPVTFEVIQKRSKMETARLEEGAGGPVRHRPSSSTTGRISTARTPNHEKRWVLDMFVPGSAEIMMIHPNMCGRCSP